MRTRLEVFSLRVSGQEMLGSYSEMNIIIGNYCSKDVLPEVIMNQDVEYLLGQTVFRPNLSSLAYNGETHSLSVRQTEILQMLAENLGRPVERDVILDKIWGDANYSNSLALNVQISYIRRLLSDPSVTIISIKKKGYILTITPQ